MRAKREDSVFGGWIRRDPRFVCSFSFGQYKHKLPLETDK